MNTLQRISRAIYKRDLEELYSLADSLETLMITGEERHAYRDMIEGAISLINDAR